ncbi:hypothetical protein SAMN05421831_10171 [Allopseudospirillum japonicum]|uniref:Uncharacterized protein n=1 Tax=Allopseudospirillum japonicum TaxID=64971 RepID=A0A1H6QEI2_9GAMM|nr:hypothetical protein [Allopseudospirillum japonicum]SEI37635.1 hypothetical protein SAMN05421831_10171 [Allopseudospirillum japonicum]
MAWFQSKLQVTRREQRVSLEREGNAHIQRISEAVTTLPWSITLLQLLWTAGPVTLLSAYGGYFLGHGKPPSSQTLIYFVGYTVITGVIGIGAKIVYNMTQGRTREKAQQDVAQVMNALPDLILAVRDMIVATYEEEEVRKREAALQLLRKIDLSPESLELAVFELTSDLELARLLTRIDSYRRVGLFSRIKDLHAEYLDQVEKVLTELNEASPEGAALLRERFQGRAPNLKKGVVRDDGFIERILAASEEDNELLMTLPDVEEMLILALELINGRKIPMLIFNYRGRWKLAHALDELETARAHYRIARATGSSRLKVLATFLLENTQYYPDESLSGYQSERLLEASMQAMDRLGQHILNLCTAVRIGKTEKLAELRQEADQLGTAIRLYKALRQAYQEIGRDHARLLKAAQEWDAIASRHKDATTRLKLGPGRLGLRIIEKQINLDDQEKIQVCQALARWLEEAGLELEQQERRFFVRESGKRRHFSIEMAKQLAVDIALILEPYIHLSRPEIQRALNTANAAYFGHLEPGMSVATKAALVNAMVKEVEQDLSRAAERLAVALVKHYRVELTEKAQNFLQETYGARPATLQLLANYAKSSSQQSLVSFLSSRPPAAAAVKRDWYLSLLRARQVADRF